MRPGFSRTSGQGSRHEGPDLVLRDAAGGELARLACARDVRSAHLSSDAARVAVVYRDMGVEVFALV